jgi:hypothetical protein
MITLSGDLHIFNASTGNIPIQTLTIRHKIK